MTRKVFLNFMKPLNLQYHMGKMNVGRLVICILMMSGHLNSAFVASDDIRAHTELRLSNQSIPFHYQVCYSPFYNVISMLVSLFLWTVFTEAIFLQQMSFNYSTLQIENMKAKRFLHWKCQITILTFVCINERW